jgi:hypothetical protein
VKSFLGGLLVCLYHIWETGRNGCLFVLHLGNRPKSLHSTENQEDGVDDGKVMF